MADDLKVFDFSYAGVNGIKLTDTNGNIVTYTPSVPSTAINTAGEYTIDAGDTITMGTGLQGDMSVHGTRVLTNSWDFTTGLTDSVGGLSATLGNNATQSSSGVSTAGDTQYVSIPVQITTNKTYEVDFGTMSKTFGSTHGRFFMYNSSSGLIYQSGAKWNVYSWTWDNKVGPTDATALSGKTLRVTTHPLTVVANGSEYSAFMMKFYVDGVLWHTMQSYQALPVNANITIGAATQSFCNMTVTAVRVYDGIGS